MIVLLKDNINEAATTHQKELNNKNLIRSNRNNNNYILTLIYIEKRLK